MEPELVHYGVKGMKWGVRRAELNKPNARYTDIQRNKDKKLVGNRGVKRINRRMNQGQTHMSALRKTGRNQAARRLVVAGVLIAGPNIAEYASLTSGSIAQRAQTKRGEAAAAAAMGLPRTASSGPNYSKQKRNGVYNISSM